jgi:hypothetical protein
MYVYWILFSNSLCMIFSAYLYCTAFSVNKPQLNPILTTSFNRLCFLISLLLLFANVPLLNSLSAKKKKEKKSTESD